MNEVIAFASTNPGWTFLIVWVCAASLARIFEALAEFHPLARVVHHHNTYRTECGCCDDDCDDDDEKAAAKA